LKWVNGMEGRPKSIEHGQRGAGLPESSRYARVLLLFLLALIAGGCVQFPIETPAEPEEAEVVTPVDEQFTNFVLLSGGTALFGEALGPAFTDDQTGRKVQYFRRLMLEYDAIANEVRIVPLGEWAFSRLSNWKPAQLGASEDVLHFEGTELTVQGEFKEYYEASGGEDIFGAPISPQLEVAGRRTQFFENAGLEWRPGATIERRVQMAPLGLDHYRAEGIYRNPGRFGPGNLAFIDEVTAAVSVASPILYAGDEQTIYVSVEEPDNRRPVEAITITVDIAYDGKVESVNLGQTNEAGMAQGSLPLDGATPGQRVQVIVTAISPVYGEVGTAAHSFKTWW
jgi:hypothetical protein